MDDLTYNAINFLTKAKPSEKIEDVYYFSKKGKEIAETIIEKLDACTTNANLPLNESYELSSLAYEQEQLKQQQLALEQKQAELKQKLIQKKEEELSLKKENLISTMELTIVNNIKTFNDALRACGCNNEILSPAINKEDLLSQTAEDIRLSFIKTLKELSTNYTLKLTNCNN